jgi:hypothetical protein
VAKGWVFTTSGLWPVGHGSAYLVNDMQKAELLARLERRRFGFVLPFFALFLLSQLRYDWIGALTGLVGIHSDILAVTIIVLVLVLFVTATQAIRWFDLRSILAGAVATPIRVGFWGGLLAWPRSLAQTLSFVGLAVTFVYFPVSLIAVWHAALTSNDGHFSLLFFLVVNLALIVPTAVFVVALFLKLRAKRPPE